MHKERARSVSEPSRVPGLLRDKLAEFKVQHAQHMGELEEFQKMHDRLASEARATAAKQRLYKEDVVARCQRDEARAREREAECRTQLRDSREQLMNTLTKIQGLLGELAQARALAAEKASERMATAALLGEAIRFQEAIEAGSAALSRRFGEGVRLLRAFAGWLQDAYGWMERTMAEKRSALEMQMPEERENFHALLAGLASDATRRKENLQWAMAELLQTRDKKLNEAKLEEQVGTRRAKGRVKNLMGEIRTMDEELHAMQNEYDAICDLQQQLQEKCTDMFGASAPAHAGRPSFSARALGWVGSFFHNKGPSQAWYVPPALHDLRRSLEDQARAQQQQQSTWWFWRRRVHGKRPRHELDGPAWKRQRLPLPN